MIHSLVLAPIILPGGCGWWRAPLGQHPIKPFPFPTCIQQDTESRNAVGFWIDRGELAYPVEEITVAGNLKEMLLGIEMVGNDLTFRNSVVAPTLKIRRMTVAGH